MRKPSREQIARNLQYEDANLLKSPAEAKAIFEKRKKKEETFRACLSPEMLAFYEDMKKDDELLSVFREVEAYEFGWQECETAMNLPKE
ncbi:MAG: hypothetical protein KBS76_03735 [Ruminococcus sp.]|nr:hypothetical protein [Candidatus Apopatosoma intestinale]